LLTRELRHIVRPTVKEYVQIYRRIVQNHYRSAVGIRHRGDARAALGVRRFYLDVCVPIATFSRAFVFDDIQAERTR